MEWLDRAACVRENQDPELFFPVGGSGPALRDVREAKAVCCRCPVATQCLEWALETEQSTGVWGGTSETERAALSRASRRRARNAKRRAPAGRGSGGRDAGGRGADGRSSQGRRAAGARERSTPGG